MKMKIKLLFAIMASVVILFSVFTICFASSAPSCKVQIYGQVNRQNKGENISKAFVQVRSSGGSITKKYTLDKKGYYEISDLDDGYYTIQAISDPTTGFLNSMKISITVKSGASSMNRIYFTLPKVNQTEYSCNGLWPGGKQLVGRVDGPVNVLFEGYILITGSNGFSKKAVIDVTDQYSFKGLKDGKYTIQVVSANPSYLAPVTKKSIIVSGGICIPNRYDFSFCSTTKKNYVNELRRRESFPKGQQYIPEGLYQDGSQLIGWMRGEEIPIFKGTIEIRGRYGTYSIPVDSDGHFEVKGMMDGMYLASAISTDPDYECTTKPVILIVEDGACNPKGVVFDYVSSITGLTVPMLKGSAVDPSGKPYCSGRIDITRADGTYVDGVSINADGNFFINALRAGEYTLTMTFSESTPYKTSSCKITVSTDPNSGKSVYSGLPVEIQIQLKDAPTT